MRHVHLDRWLDAILDLGELEGWISSILVSTLWHVKYLFPNLILVGLSRMQTAEKKVLFVFKNGEQLFFNWLPLWKIQELSDYQKKKLISPPALCILHSMLWYLYTFSCFIILMSTCVDLFLYLFFDLLALSSVKAQHKMR